MLLPVQVEAFKLLSIKLINTATLVYQLYRIQTSVVGPSTTSPLTISTLQASPQSENYVQLSYVSCMALAAGHDTASLGDRLMCDVLSRHSRDACT